MEHLKKSMLLHVSVPVLSLSTVCTIPSSSFRLLVRARAGVSLSAWYIPRSLFKKTIAWHTLTNSSETYSEMGMRYPYSTYDVRNATIPTVALFFGLNTMSASRVCRYQCAADSSLIHTPHATAVTAPITNKSPSIISTTRSIPSSI